MGSAVYDSVMKGEINKQMKAKTSERIYGVILIALMLLVLGNIIFWGSRKEGYHVDELYSYGLANSEYLPFMHFGEQEYSVKDWMKEYGAGENPLDLIRNIAKDLKMIKNSGWRIKDTEIYSAYAIARENSNDVYTTTWMSGQTYRDYLSVSDSNRFNYASVYYNQRGDVHPPLFYILLHSVCSFAVGVFSKWFGIAVNAAAILTAVFLLYRLVSRHFGGKAVGLIVASVYGLSIGAVSAAVFIRMYALLTVMVLGTAYAHLELFKADWQLKGKKRVLIVLFLLLGYLTHYYFVIFAATTALVVMICMALGKRWKELLRYFVTLAVTGAVGVILWPFSIKHIFFGYRGRESLSALSGKGYDWGKTGVMLKYLTRDTIGLGTWALIALLAVVAVTIVLMIVKEKKVSRETGEYIRKNLMIAVPCLVYVLAVPQMVPFLTDRYVMCIYPFIVLLMITAPRSLADMTVKAEKAGIVTAGVFAACFMVVGHIGRTPWYLYSGGQETESVPESTDCVYIIPDGTWNCSPEDTLLLSKCSRVAVVFDSNLGTLAEGYSDGKSENLMVITRGGLNADEKAEELSQILGGESPVGLTEVSREESADRTRIIYRSADPIP